MDRHDPVEHARPAAGGGATVVLVSPYELGRQPFALAHPAAWLREAGFSVHCLDLSLERLDSVRLASADGVALYVGMHTATRIAVQALPRIRQLAPRARLSVFGLYAPMNEALLRAHGADAVFGGEFEDLLLRWCHGLHAPAAPAGAAMRMEKVRFRVPDRSTLPALERYAHLVLPDGSTRVAGFAESSRGCKHRCRHCPVVPVYDGRFRAIPLDVVLADIHQQVAAGASHISFGDPDFLNGPTHALRLVRALSEACPGVTFDATIKIQHLVGHAALLPELKRCGCLFVISAVEAVDDAVLHALDKNHSCEDFERAVALTRAAGIALAPTFVAFTPWTTTGGYLALLERLVALELVEAVPPVQLAIRLLVPEGSRLLELPDLRARLGAFDMTSLGYPWRHPDPKVDRLQADVQALAAEGQAAGTPRAEIFASVWQAAHAAAARPAPALPAHLGEPVPHLSEPWYCCAEPTDQQLRSF